jgi:hypothetical protein
MVSVSVLAMPAAQPRFRMGLQMYMVRDPMAKDALGTLKQIAALVYRKLESYGFEPDTLKVTISQALSFFGQRQSKQAV